MASLLAIKRGMFREDRSLRMLAISIEAIDESKQLINALSISVPRFRGLGA